MRVPSSWQPCESRATESRAPDVFAIIKTSIVPAKRRGSRRRPVSVTCRRLAAWCISGDRTDRKTGGCARNCLLPRGCGCNHGVSGFFDRLALTQQLGVIPDREDEQTDDIVRERIPHAPPRRGGRCRVLMCLKEAGRRETWASTYCILPRCGTSRPACMVNSLSRVHALEVGLQSCASAKWIRMRNPV